MQIYKTINLVDGKIYIGKDVKSNPTYLGSGVRLKYAIKKYGIDSFKKEVLEDDILDKKTLSEREIFNTHQSRRDKSLSKRHSKD